MSHMRNPRACRRGSALSNISEVLEGFPECGDEGHQDDIFEPVFLAIFGQHRFKQGPPHVLIKPVGK